MTVQFTITAVSRIYVAASLILSSARIDAIQVLEKLLIILSGATRLRRRSRRLYVASIGQVCVHYKIQ